MRTKFNISARHTLSIAKSKPTYYSPRFNRYSPSQKLTGLILVKPPNKLHSYAILHTVRQRESEWQYDEGLNERDDLDEIVEEDPVQIAAGA